MVGPYYPTDDVIAFDVPSLSFGICYSWEICVSVRLYGTSTPFQNCMVDLEYEILPSLPNRMVEFKYGIFHI